MHLIGNLCCRFIRVAQFYFYTHDEGTVNPVFGSGTADLADDGAQVSLCETHAPGIVSYLVMLGTMLGDQLEETVENVTKFKEENLQAGANDCWPAGQSADGTAGRSGASGQLRVL